MKQTRTSIPGILLTIMTGFMVAPIALAAPKGDPDIVKTLNKAQGMIRQLSQEKAELEGKLAPMQKELDDTKRALEEKSKQMEAKAKELLGQAKRALDKGQTAEARAAIIDIKAMDVKLGLFDRLALGSLEKRLASQPAAPPPQAAATGTRRRRR